MSRAPLDKITLAHSPLTDTIYLYRHGKDPHVALDKREALSDVLGALVPYMMHNSPKGSRTEITDRATGERYLLSLTPIEGEPT